MAVFAGAVVGATAALLVAPKSGNESRRFIAYKTGAIQNGAKGYFSTVRGWVRRPGRAVVEEDAATTVNGVAG